MAEIVKTKKWPAVPAPPGPLYLHCFSSGPLLEKNLIEHSIYIASNIPLLIYFSSRSY